MYSECLIKVESTSCSAAVYLNIEKEVNEKVAKPLREDELMKPEANDHLDALLTPASCEGESFVTNSTYVLTSHRYFNDVVKLTRIFSDLW
jgi:hypothetical protein